MNSDALVDYFERLSPATLDQLDRFYAQAAWFKDPFHEVEGIEAIGAILRHTFDRLPGARFRVTRQFSASDGDLMLLWELDFVMPITSAPTTIVGATHFAFDAAGKVIRHRDYWDAAEELYGRLPLLKWLMRGLARRATAPVPSARSTAE